MTSWSLTLGPLHPIVPEKSPNRAKSNYNFHWKLKGDRFLILTYLDRELAIWFWFCPSSGGKLGSKFDQKFKLCVHPLSIVSGKIRVFQNALNSICTTMRTSCGQNFSSVWCCLIELLLQNLLKWTQLGPKLKTYRTSSR